MSYHDDQSRGIRLLVIAGHRRRLEKSFEEER
jgi:hypothetical protein